MPKKHEKTRKITKKHDFHIKNTKKPEKVTKIWSFQPVYDPLSWKPPKTRKNTKNLVKNDEKPPQNPDFSRKQGWIGLNFHPKTPKITPFHENHPKPRFSPKITKNHEKSQKMTQNHDFHLIFTKNHPKITIFTRNPF